jgi:hypothetical protein
MKTLGDALVNDRGAAAKYWRGESPHVLARELRMYSESRVVMGGYFQGRLTRSLKATDVVAIYVPEGNEEALKTATAIKEFKQPKLPRARKRRSNK